MLLGNDLLLTRRWCQATKRRVFHALDAKRGAVGFSPGDLLLTTFRRFGWAYIIAGAGFDESLDRLNARETLSADFDAFQLMPADATRDLAPSRGNIDAVSGAAG